MRSADEPVLGTRLDDDAIRAVKLIVSKMADAVIEAKQGEAEEAEAAEENAEA